MKKIWLLALVSLVFTVPAASVKAGSNGLSLVVKTDKPVYKTKEPVAMTLTVVNQDSVPFSATLPNSQIFDFYLYQADKIVWRWSEGRVFMQVLGTLTLEPGVPHTYTAKFDQKLGSGDWLSPGKYTLVGILKTIDKPCSDPVTIEIVP
jgi:hypothetical protein